MKKLSFILSLLFVPFFLFAADEADLKKISEEEKVKTSIQMAISNPDYMVTPGDVYSLNYAANTSAVSYTISVDSTYKIRVANLAVLDATGKSYLRLKREIEEIVQKNYPMSGVQFVLMQPSLFTVVINGEVEKTTEKEAWALTRLSKVLTGVTNEYSSLRDVTVVSSNGKKRVYDLFKAERDGDLSQNPYVRPGDVITINKINRVVNISGAVERPGQYELMKNENLKELIEYYGNGLTDLADISKIEITRKRTNKENGGEKLYLPENSITDNFELLNGDHIVIRNFANHLPSIIVEGIVNVETNNETAEAETPKDTVRRLSIKFYEGENYSTFIRRNKELFTPYSDLTNAYIERNSDKIALDVEKIISDEAFVSQVYVDKADKLIIPFMNKVVRILIKGEVNTVREESAWPLRRLSQIIADNLTDYSSTRDIQITSVEGITHNYDLFDARRFGDMAQDPYVRSGETITIQRISRKVELKGAVERPGSYQLLEGENLKDLIEYYGNGLEPMADSSRIELTRRLANEEGAVDIKSGEKIYLNQKDIDNNTELLCYDIVYVSSYRDLKPVMFMEGAIKASEEVDLQASDRQSVQFENGTNYAYLIRSYGSWFKSSAADVENAYIIRDDKKIPINLNQMLYDQTFYSDLIVEPNDVLMVPFKQNFVSVAGAVYKPGRYPYIPDRTYDYYIGLAGGFITEKNSFDAVKITDINGNKVKKSEFITPECTITAESNSGLYKFNQYSGIVTTILTVLSTSLSAIAVVNSMKK